MGDDPADRPTDGEAAVIPGPDNIDDEFPVCAECGIDLTGDDAWYGAECAYADAFL